MMMKSITRSAVKPALALLASALPVLSSNALPKDDPITPAQAVSMLQEGVVKEFSKDLYLNRFDEVVEIIKGVKKAGYHHIRFRQHWTDYSKYLELDQPYPPERFEALGKAIDVALAEGLGVVLAYRGAGPMEEGHLKQKPGEFTQRYIRFWNEIATRFQDKSHRLFFNLFIEPGALGGNSPIVFPLLTEKIRKTNPTRTIVYYKCPGPAPEKKEIGGKKVKKDASQRGRDYYANSKNMAPESAGIYYIWDYHILKGDMTANRWKVKQAYDFQQHVKQAMWSGAWARNVGEKEEWMALGNAKGVAQALREYGLSSAILCCMGSTFPIKGEARTSPLNIALTQGPSIWWNLVDNPGFDQETEYWTSNGGKVSTTGGIEKSPYLSLPSGKSVVQDVTLALKNNGTGTYDVLGSFYAKSSPQPQIQIKVTADNGTQQFTASIPKLAAGKWGDVHSKIDVTWSGTLKKAELIITAGSTTTGVDKLGLTQFYRPPVLDRTVWPGEVDRPYIAPKYADKGIVLKLEYQKMILAGNKMFIDSLEEIKECQEKIDKIAIEFFPQYKPGGKNPESLELQVKNKLKKSRAKEFQIRVEEIERTLRDWVLINDKELRRKYINKYNGLPPSLAGRESEFKDALPIGDPDEMKAKLKKLRAQQKKGKREAGPKTSGFPLKAFTISKTKITGKKQSGITFTFNITKDTKILDYDGNPTTVEKIDHKSMQVMVKYDPKDEKLKVRDAISIKDLTVISAKELAKLKKKGKENEPVKRIWTHEEKQEKKNAKKGRNKKPGAKKSE